MNQNSMVLDTPLTEKTNQDGDSANEPLEDRVIVISDPMKGKQSEADVLATSENEYSSIKRLASKVNHDESVAGKFVLVTPKTAKNQTT